MKTSILVVSVVILVFDSYCQARNHNIAQVERFLKRIRSDANEMLLEIDGIDRSEKIGSETYGIRPKRLKSANRDMTSAEEENVVWCDTTHFCADGYHCCYSAGIPYQCCINGRTCSGLQCV